MSEAAKSDEFVDASVRNIERREGVRATVETEVEITSFAKFLGTAVDISRGGIFVETHETLEIGDRLDLEMWIPEAGEYIAVPGEVRWHEPAEQRQGETLNGYGLEFVEVGDEMQQRLESIVERCHEGAE